MLLNRGSFPFPPKALLVLLLILVCPSTGRGENRRIDSVSVLPDDAVLESNVSRLAVRDFINLLDQGLPGADVGLGTEGGDVVIRIFISPPRSKKSSRLQRFTYPPQAYSWKSSTEQKKIALRLDAESAEAVSFGLYGLLQEKLGFRFVHPRDTVVPSHRSWPLPDSFAWAAAPRFDKRGFHLHTLHPVELTEQLHDPDRRAALRDLQEYVDWLARNGQNLLQFYLLRSLDKARWPDHIRPLVDYAHARGLRVGTEISLFMLQQNAFQVLRLTDPCTPYHRQVDDTLAWLFQVPWDFVSVDFTLGEHLPDVGRLLPSVRAHLEREVTERYGALFLDTTHVIGDCPGSGSPRAGILIHSVMCYSILDQGKPVYGKPDQRHMLVRAFDEARSREAWYWPESSYWVAFDNSVPVLLLPYLEARLRDMDAVRRIGVVGHLTFTSGWEWGYWIIDWSVARWSWSYAGGDDQRSVLDPFNLLFEKGAPLEALRQVLLLQQRFLEGDSLIPYLAAADPSTELPWPLSPPFQPRTRYSAAYILRKAPAEEVRAFEEGPLRKMEEFAAATIAALDTLELPDFSVSGPQDAPPDMTTMLLDELSDSLLITALRSRHRALVLRAAVAQRAKPRFWQPTTVETDVLLRKASEVRSKALEIVRRREGKYRYPSALIARRRIDHSSYGFGYLYPVSNLHFWRREELQVRKRRFDALFMNIWDFMSVIGAGSLWRDTAPAP